jgi:hypothetical protein
MAEYDVALCVTLKLTGFSEVLTALIIRASHNIPEDDHRHISSRQNLKSQLWQSLAQINKDNVPYSLTVSSPNVVTVIREDETDRTCSTHGGDETCLKRFNRRLEGKIEVQTCERKDGVNMAHGRVQ